MRRVLTLFFVVFGLLGAASGQTLDDYVGDWGGDLEVAPSVTLPLIMHVMKEEDGYSATLDSPAQGASGLPASSVSVDETGQLTVVLSSLGASYKGRLNEAGTAIEGTFEQAGQSFPLTLEKGTAADFERQARSQEPQGERPYREIDVTLIGEGGVELAGTLVIPEGEGPFPAVVMITGSGPQDRDEFLPPMNHKPFLVLSDYLARQGIASLRYDDRGAGDSGGSFAQSTIQDFAGDAAAALAFLDARPETSSTGFLGHSEGGVTAGLAIGEKGAPADFIVTLAGPFTQVSQVIVEQIETIGRAQGADEATISSEVTLQLQLTSIVLSAETPEAACAVLDLLIAGAPENQKAQIRQLCTPIFWSLFRVDPAPYYEAYEGPVLALFGGKDVQVAASTHAPIAERILADRAGSEVIIFEDKNHLFQSAETGAMTEYSSIEETMSPVVMSHIAEWIHHH